MAIEHIALLVTLLFIAVGIISFLLGYSAADDIGKRDTKALRDRLVWERKNHDALSGWIKDHWPSEYRAYQLGHQEGYQQGILQSPELNDEEPA